VTLHLQLNNHPHAWTSDINLDYRTGPEGLHAILETMRQDGVHHVMLNLAPTGAPVRDTLARIAERIF
jgi:hypothetical protein